MKKIMTLCILIFLIFSNQLSGHPGWKDNYSGKATEKGAFYTGKYRNLFLENGPLAYVCDVLHNDVRSEGISYGMMIAVQMDNKEDFDAIWNWAITYMYVSKPDHPSEGYFAWSLKRDGTSNSETAAPDGEEYMVMVAKGSPAAGVE